MAKGKGMTSRTQSKYTANPWRDLGHAKWHDPLAALEDPKSTEFKTAVKAEDVHWNRYIQQIPPPRRRFWRQAMHAFQDAAHPVGRRHAEVTFRWCGHTVAKQRGAAGYTIHVWIDDWSARGAWSAVGFGEGVGSEGWFWTLEDIGKGAEHLELTVWHWGPRAAKPRAVWRRDPVGPSVEIVGGRIFYSTVENLLRYPDIWVAPVETGKAARRLFHEPDLRYQVGFEVRGGTFFVHKANALDQMLGVLEGDRVRWIADKTSTLVGIGGPWYGTNDAVVNWTTGVSVPFPKGQYLEDACLGRDGILLAVLVSKGRDTLWSLQTEGNGEKAAGKWTCIHGDTDSATINAIQIFHEPTPFPTFLLRAPMIPDEVWRYVDAPQSRLRRVSTYPEPLRLPYFGGGHEQVPYTWVSAVKNPRALLVEGYGAYGISARRAYPVRWLPYLAAGWAVAYVCPRGGREDGDAWYDGGRTAARKHHTFEDTAAAIRKLQSSLHIAPAATVFFGRSAGGWLAANIAQEHGDLVAAVYAEVPYVDVLRTTTNPELPLTALEYDEFGDPAARPAEFKALSRISPVDTVPPCRKHCPLLVVRTAIHDKQVLPYEALKWAARLREAGWARVFVGIDHDGGHFAGAKSMAEQRAEDAALIESSLTDAALLETSMVATPLDNVNKTRRKKRSVHITRRLVRV